MAQAWMAKGERGERGFTGLLLEILNPPNASLNFPLIFKDATAQLAFLGTKEDEALQDAREREETSDQCELQCGGNFESLNNAIGRFLL
jgi:hypothetical protein